MWIYFDDQCLTIYPSACLGVPPVGVEGGLGSHDPVIRLRRPDCFRHLNSEYLIKI